MPLEWSEERSPNAESSYTHVVAETPLGKIVIEWKGWKEFDLPDAILPWGEHVCGSDLDDTKALVQAAWDAKATEILAFTKGR